MHIQPFESMLLEEDAQDYTRPTYYNIFLCQIPPKPICLIFKKQIQVIVELSDLSLKITMSYRTSYGNMTLHFVTLPKHNLANCRTCVTSLHLTTINSFRFALILNKCKLEIGIGQHSAMTTWFTIAVSLEELSPLLEHHDLSVCLSSNDLTSDI